MSRRLLSLALLPIVLAACGGGGAPSPGSGGSVGAGNAPAGTVPPGAVATTTTAATIDSCTLLGDAEIEAATREGVAERRASTLTQVFSSVCDITLDGGGSLTVSVLPSGGRRLWEVSFAPSIGSDLLEEAVPDLGDAAARSASGDDVMVLADDVLFDILFIEFGRDDKAPAVRYLAEIVLAKLPCIASGCVAFTPPPPPSGAASIDACALLTIDEIKQTTGIAAGGQEPAGGAECRWTLDVGGAPGLYAIGLTVRASGGRDRFDFLAQGMERLSGLGDGAFRSGGNTDGSITAVTGDRLVTLSYALPLDTTDPGPLVVPLVELALSRL